jgi:hypothetical protein
MTAFGTTAAGAGTTADTTEGEAAAGAPAETMFATTLAASHEPSHWQSPASAHATSDRSDSRSAFTGDTGSAVAIALAVAAAGVAAAGVDAAGVDAAGSKLPFSAK